MYKGCFWFSLFAVLILAFNCKKNTIIKNEPIPVLDTVKPKISFTFVNRLGYKSDTNGVRWLQAVSPYSKFYNPATNHSQLVQTSYNRYHGAFPLSDSIELIKYVNLAGVQYAFEVDMYWYYYNSFNIRHLKFQTKNWPNACDTIKVARDTIIKFVYPDDTISNSRFIRIL